MKSLFTHSDNQHELRHVQVTRELMPRKFGPLGIVWVGFC